jgi:CBS domain-containing protein
MSVKDIMRYGVISVSPDESVNRVMKLMTHHRLRHMPVLRDGKLAGIISIGDVVKQRPAVSRRWRISRRGGR